MKTIQLLQTKIAIPPVRADLVPRPRLVDQLNRGLSGKLTLISAPAGFGKTTLLASWARGCGRTIAWLSLDESEDDPTRFLAYLGAALGEIEGEIKARILEGLESPPVSDPQSSSEEDIFTGLINRLNTIPEPVVIVLDDYHLISTQTIHRWVEFLVEHQPAHMHMVIASRADPPLPLARWRGRGQLIELRLADLRFTAEEVTAFLHESMGLEIEPEDLQAIAHKTEGWIAGLQMAGLAMQSPSAPDSADHSDFIQAFTGSNRFILDYLLEEVLQRQPASIQNFLLETSVLERLSGPLCDYVLNRDGGAVPVPPVAAPLLSSEDSQALLEYLDQANLFIVPLDDRREWYRYHRLFSDLLRKRLRHSTPSLPPILHRRASQWFERNGFTYQAIEHALAGEDLDRAADLIQEAAERVLQRGELATLKNWISCLPQDFVRSRPDLYLYYVTSLIFSGAPMEIVQSNLERLQEHYKDRSAEAMVLRAYMGLYQMRLILAEDLARQALETSALADSFLRTTAEWILSVCQLSVEDLQKRLTVLERLTQKSRTMDNRMFMVASQCQLAEALMKMGRVVEAHDLYRQTYDESIGKDGRPLPIAGQAMIGIGLIQYEWNHLEEAECSYRKGIELIQQWHQFGAIEGYMGLAECLQAKGVQQEAETALHQAHVLARAYDSTDIDDRVVAMFTARFRLKQGDAGEVWRYLTKYNEGVLSTGSEQADSAQAGNSVEVSIHKYEQLLRARAHLVEDQPAQALEVLDPWLDVLEEQHRAMLLIELEILRALAFKELQHEEKAQTAFKRALSLAEPGRFVRLFIEEGKPIAALLRKAIDQSCRPQYASRLLAALERSQLEKGKYADSPRQPALVEPLSERELEVLHYLRSALAVPEIAQELYIAESTVRSHVKNIYSKLGVHSRMEAIQRAEEMDLFS